MHKGVVVLIGLVALAAGYFMANVGTPSRSANTIIQADSSVFMYPQPRPLTAVNLVDMHGEAITEKAFQNSWWMVYFGFTHCPDACPMALANMQRIKSLMPEDSNIRFALISVDPQRDTPEKLREYVTHFNEDFYAATGNKEQLDLLTAGLHVVYTIGADAAQTEDYVVDHSNFMVLINPAGQHAGIISAPHVPEIISQELQPILAAADH